MSTYATSVTKRRRTNRSTTDEVTVFPAEPVQPHKLDTPPQTPELKRRRRFQGISEESGEDLIHLQDGIRNEDYRAGGPILCRLPTESEAVFSGPTYDVWNSGQTPLKDAIKTILARWNIDEYHLNLVKRYFIYDECAPETDTVYVHTKKLKPSNDWLRACLAIRETCAHYGIPSMNVEITDPQGIEPMESSSVEQTHPIAAEWGKLRPTIVQILGARDWLSLSLLRRGKASIPRPHPVTVVVTIDLDTETGGWDLVATKISEVLDAAKMTDVMVETGRGMVWRSNDEYPLPSNSWTDAAKFGGSIKARDPLVGSGTLGGMVRLSWPNGTYGDFGLTCFHCVVSPKSADASHKTWAQIGLRPENQSNILIDMPSPIDHTRAIEKLQSDISYLNTTSFEDLKKRHEDPEVSEFMTRSEKFKYTISLNTINIMKEQIATASNFMAAGKMMLGNVIAGSGFRVAPNKRCALDWALINIRPGREGKNILPVKDDAPVGVRNIYSPMYPVLTSIGQLKLGQVFLKLGRSTGIGYARFQEIKDTETLHSWQRNVAGDWEDVKTVECAVVSEYGAALFGRAGDSGSFVLSMYGELMGLYFAGNDYTRTSYFTPVEVLFDDIMRLTGATKVSLPE